MAAATTSPVKILTDLGYEIWEMEIPEDFRSALIEAINTLIMSNPSDGRIPILQEAIRAVQKPKFKAKKIRLNVDKVLNKTQPRLEGQKLQEDSEEVQSNNDVLSSVLVPRLDGISSALSGIGGILASQLSLERIAYERQRKRDLLNEKREREKSLENEGNTIGKTIKKIVEQPIKSFGERLLQFLKSVGLGAAVLSLYNWLQDNENLKKVKAIADWLGDNGGKLIKSLIKLGRLGVASKIGNLLKKVGSVFTDFLFVKPIKTLTEIIRRSISEVLSGGAKGIKGQQMLKTRNQMKAVIEAASNIRIGKNKLGSSLLGKVSPKELNTLTNENIITFLTRRGFSDLEISRILTQSIGPQNFTEAQKIFTQNKILRGFEGSKVGGLGDEISTIIENPPNTGTGLGQKIFDQNKLPGKTKPVKAKEVDTFFRKVIKFLEKKGLKDVGEVKSLRKLIWSGIVNGLGVLDIGLDTADAIRTWNEGMPIPSMFYALAALSSAVSFKAPIFAAPAFGFSLLGIATENPNVLEGLKKGGSTLGLPVPGAGLGGAGGIDATIPFMFNRSSIDTPMSQDIASFMPNDSISSPNISFLQGGNQSQVTSGNGSSSKLQEHSSVDEGNVNITSVESTVGAYT